MRLHFSRLVVLYEENTIEWVVNDGFGFLSLSIHMKR